MRRFWVEPMAARLVTWLRLLGYEARLVERPPARVPPGVVLLTRRRALAKRPGVLLIAHDRIEDQLAQVVVALKLRPDPRAFFSRCLRCGDLVEELPREQAAGQVPEYTLATAERFTQCTSCGRVYWPGSHGERARALLKRVLARAGQRLQ